MRIGGSAGTPRTVHGIVLLGDSYLGAGLLDILSSDYVPFSLMQAVFSLEDTITLPEAVAMVTRHPAGAAGFEDRGEIAVGKRADLVQVASLEGVPVVRTVWREGRRVL